MRKVCLFMILASVTIGSLWSQTDAWLQPDNWLLSKPSGYDVAGAKGSPELFDTYLPAVIYMKNDREINHVKINIFNEDDMVVSKPYKGIEALYDIEENDISHFVITLGDGSRKTFVRMEKTAFADDYAQTAFYEALTEKRVFVKRSYKEFKKAEKVGGYSSGRARDEFVLINKYYLKNQGEQKYQDVKLSKKAISKALGSKALDAKRLMKQHGWKWSNELHIQLMMEQLQAL